jgi:twitching motility protein PilT
LTDQDLVPTAPAPAPPGVAHFEVTEVSAEILEDSLVAPIPNARGIEDTHIDELLEYTVQKGATDLHLAVGIPPVIRIDGALIAAPFTPLGAQHAQRLVYDILTDEQIQRFEQTLELDFSHQLHALSRFRCNTFRDKGNVSSAYRVIPAQIPTVRDLSLPLVLEDLARKPRGLILVTGPTGSGKSTTLAAMTGQINRERACHVITIEDPIEYLHTHIKSIVNQREVGHDTREFPNALRAALREDPDVILVGEMRDLETMALAVTAAETGHLVFATVHTNSAAETVDRIVDVFPPGQQEQIRIQLSNNLQAVLTQQLLPRANTPGRICAMEIMTATPAIRNLVRENKAHQITSIIQTSANVGMQTMDQCLADYYQRGLITYEEAMSRAMNPDELKKMVFTRAELAEGASGSGQRAARRP